MRFKKSIVIPSALLIYLIFMAFFSYDEFMENKNYLYYWGVIGFTFLIIVLLYFSLKRKEKLQKEREDDIKKQKEKFD